MDFIRTPMKRDDFNAGQFFQQERMERIKRMLLGKKCKYKPSTNEIEAYRIHKCKEENFCRKEIKNYLEINQIRDKVEEEVNERMFYKSKRCAC